MTESEISADLALETIARLRKRGGTWRLWQTAVTLPFSVVAALMTVDALATAPVTTVLAFGAVALGCGAITVRNLRQNSFIDPYAARRIRKLPSPRVAMLVGNRLLVGSSGMPRAAWCEVTLSDREVRELRTLALPAARVVD